ncbi:MAG TPA: hypothetical protein VFQ91_21675 [Bryobacteraceae bacterium]|nr:hypothetical protein [Bryobacteraceae bacterium]
MIRKTLSILGGLALAVSMLAADITGKWTGKVETPNGSRDVNMTFKADGSTLTGTVSGRNGDSPIENGKISGDDISFTVTRKFNDNEIKMNYTGKVSGDSIQLKYQMRDNDVTLTLKRAAS